MEEKDLKKDMTVYDLAIMMCNGFERLETSLRSDMKTGFLEADKKFAEINLRFADVNLRFDRMDRDHQELLGCIKTVELQNKVRLEILEDRTVVLKKVIEKELDTKIAW